MSVMVITDDNDIPKSPDSKRVVPQPPTYSVCIANARTTLKTTPRAQIKRKCALLHQALQEQALEHLISTQQLYGESAERGIAASNDEVIKRLDALKREQFPSLAAYDNYLHITGQTIRDQLERVKFALLTAKLLDTLTGTASPHNLTPQQRTRLASFALTSKKWKVATSCESAYTVPLCNHGGNSTTSRPTPDILIAELGL